jgi:hypothetical protein
MQGMFVWCARYSTSDIGPTASSAADPKVDVAYGHKTRKLLRQSPQTHMKAAVFHMKAAALMAAAKQVRKPSMGLITNRQD